MMITSNNNDVDSGNSGNNDTNDGHKSDKNDLLNIRINENRHLLTVFFLCPKSTWQFRLGAQRAAGVLAVGQAVREVSGWVLSL